ncbi:MAG: zinc-binding dehydrogenase [Planctomycetes bacterium]|nr:zinc-binding dehydrogenase [Planctomycetota bacterium]
MKAVRLRGNSTCTVDEVPDPVPDEKSVIIRVEATGVCGSELHGFRAKPEELGKELNGGHEVAGEIVWAPKGSAYKPGMRVGARVVQGCGTCNWCKQGDETACENKSFYAADGHAELYKLGLHGIQPLPDNVDWPGGVILSGDGLGVPTRCARRLGDTAGKKVVVLGLGPVGLSCVLVQAFRGAHVWGADISPYRLDLAKQLGAEAAYQAEPKELEARVKEWTGGFGADIVILAVARAESIALAFELVRRHGMVYQVAEIHNAAFNFSRGFLYKEATMMGSWYYTSSDWPLMLKMHQEGLQYRKLVTHVMPMAQAQQAFNTFIAGESGKVVLRMRGEQGAKA